MSSKPRVRVTTDGRVRVNDGFINMAANLGTARDKASHGTYQYIPLDQYQMVMAYRQSWLAKKIVNIPAEDSTRKWRVWQADSIETNDIEELEKDLQIQRKTNRALIMAALFGGSAMYFSIDGQDPETELELDRVTKGDLRAVTVLHRYQLHVGPLDRDPESETFLTPTYFQLNGLGSAGVKIHPSRLALFPGEYNPQTFEEWSWGDSKLQSTLDIIKQNDSVAANSSSLVYEANVDVLSIPRLMEMLAEPGGDLKVATYLSTVAQIKGNNGMLVLDGGDSSVPENASGGTKFDRKGATFAGLAELWGKFQQTVAGAGDIPATRLFGISPSGMNSTGESDMQNYHNSLASDQANKITPAMHNMDEVLIRSALGSRPEELYYDWRPLKEESNEEKLEAGKKTAEILSSIKALAVIPEDTLQAVTVSSMTETGSLPGLEAAVEEHGLDMEADEEAKLAALAKAGLAPGQQAARPAAVPQPQPRAAGAQNIGDAKPMSLYIRRDVTNAKAILDHYRAQGASDLLPASELHVTILYSKQPVDWMEMPIGWEDDVRVSSGGPRLQEQFGLNEPHAQVLLFKSSSLDWRNKDLREAGASSDFPDYASHITLSYGQDLTSMVPYTGPIVLGPEIWETVDDDYKTKLLSDEDISWTVDLVDKGGMKSTKATGKGAKGGAGHHANSQPRLPKGHPDGGQFTSGIVGAASSGGAYNKSAGSAAYYELKKAGGFSFLTQKKIEGYATGKLKPSNPKEQEALDAYVKWSKADPKDVAKANQDLGGKFSAAIAAQKAAAAAKKNTAQAKLDKAVADLKSAGQKSGAFGVKPSTTKAGKPLTDTQKKQLSDLETSVTGAAHGMQKETLQNLVSGKWAPDPNKPWQAKAVKSYIAGKNFILNPPPPPKAGELGVSQIAKGPAPHVPDYYFSATTGHSQAQSKAVPKAKFGTEDHLYAINEYTGASYRKINNSLRGGNPPTDRDILRNEYIMAHKLPKDHTFLRGMKRTGIEDIALQAGGSLKVGTTFTDRGFGSLTRNPAIAKSFSVRETGGYFIKVNMKAGQNVAPVKHLSSNSNEDEFVLPMGTKYKITGIDAEKRIIDVEIL